MALQRLRLSLLGPLQIELGESGLPLKISAKGRALLAYLALTGRPHPRSALAGLLWGESPEKNARRNLRVELSKLRRVVGDVVAASHESLAIDPEAGCWLDVREFERRLRGEEMEDELRQALALYRGDLLEDLQVRDAPMFEEWVLLERERLRQLALGGLETLVRWAVQRENYELGIQDARRLLVVDPWLESAHRNLMWLLARSGQRSAALAQYEICRRTLAEELGVEPAPETSALFEQIRGGEIEPVKGAPVTLGDPGGIPAPPGEAWTPPNNLPAQTTSFVGRDRELLQIDELLADPECRLLTLIGPGGIGKTRLAMEMAARLVVPGVNAFPDGVFLVPLAEVSGPDQIIPAIGDALGLSFAGETAPQEQLGNYLREKQLLLVLDNFEHLVAGAGALVDLLQIAAGLKILVTSRERIDLYEEWLLDVPGLPYPDDHAVPAFEDFAAVQLFRQRARRINLGFSVSQEKPAIARICRLVAGMPLGIELAAAWVRGLTCEEIADQLQQNLDTLTATARNLPARQRSLRAAFTYSWDLLQPDEREAFTRIMVFHGGFTAEAASRVAGIEASVLASLVDKSLLQRSPAGRFDVHAMLRTFGEEKLEADPALREAHARYYAALLQDQETPLVFGETTAVRAVQVELENLRAGWGWATGQRAYPILTNMLTGMGSFYRLQGLFEEGAEVFSDAFQSMQANLEEGAPAPVLLGRLLVWQGEYLDELGQFRAAVDCFEKALDIFETHGAARERAATRAALGFSMSGLGDNQQAIRHLEAGLAGLSSLKDRLGMAVALHHLGIVKTQVGKRAEGLEDIEKSMAIFREVGDRRGLRNSMSILANIHIALGEYGRARELHEECQGIYDEIGDPMGKAHGLHSLSLIAFRQGDYEASENYSRQSLEIFTRFGVPYGISKALNNLGEIAWVRGAFERSKSFFVEAITANLQVPSLARHRVTGHVLRGLSRTEIALGDLDPARDHLREAMDIFLEGQFIDSALDSIPYIAEYFMAVGEEEFAVQLLAHGIENPVMEDFARLEALAVLERLAKGLDPTWVEQARTDGKKKSQSEMMAAVLARLA